MRCARVLPLLLLVVSCQVSTQNGRNGGPKKGTVCPNHSSPENRPEPCTWADSKNRMSDPMEDFRFLDWLIGGCIISNPNCPTRDITHTEYEGYDGWYNNFAQPSLGAVDTPLLRVLPPAYSDGVYQPVKRDADPITVSEELMNREAPTGQDDKAISVAGRTAFQLYFGQQVVEEILDSQGSGCPPEYFNLKIPENHKYHKTAPKVSEMPLLRTRHDFNTGYSPNNPRQQLNEITPYLDGGLVYGTSKAWADSLRMITGTVTTADNRTFHDGDVAPDGLLAWHHKLGESFPAENLDRLPMANPPPPANHPTYTKRGYTEKVNRFFKLGNPRGNENPFLLTFGILGFRWHNHIARYLKTKNPIWTGEHIFNEARKWVIATQQALIMYDWLPKYIRTEPKTYSGYNPTTNPQIAQIFQSAAMRFGHTMVTQGVHLRNHSAHGCGSHDFVRTCNSYWRSQEWFKKDGTNFERFLMGLSSQSTEKEDNEIVEDLRGSLFGPLEFSRRDLMAINIQRARDHGLPDYNTARKHYGLPVLTSLDPEHFKKTTDTGKGVPTQILEKLQTLYDNDPNMVDVWAGGLLETNKGPGQLFKSVIKDQFERIRDGDRFWFENNKNDMFTFEERQRLCQVKIIDLVLSVTNLIVTEDIQSDPFLAVNNQDNKLEGSCNSMLNLAKKCLVFKEGKEESKDCIYLPLPSVIEDCTEPKTYDHFQGSQTAYILTFLFVLLGCFGLVVIVVIVVYFRKNEKSKKVLDKIQIKKGIYKAKERISRGSNRYVLIKLNEIENEKKIEVYNLQNELIRFISLKFIDVIKIRHTEDWTYIVICVDHHYDLFLRFPETFYGDQFHQALKTFFNVPGKEITYESESRIAIRRNITTVYDRKKSIERVSKLIISKSFGKNEELQETENILQSTSKSDLNITMTLHELAEQLGIKANSVFLKQIFKIMDSDQNGFISMKEFWNVMVKFAKGTPEEKAQLFFNIYDLDGNNYISAKDLETIVRSFLGNESKNQDLKQVIENMVNAIGVSHSHGEEFVSHGKQISFEEFKKIFLDNEVFHEVRLDGQPYKEKTTVKRTFSLYSELPKSKTQNDTQKRDLAEIEKESKTYELEEKKEDPTESKVIKQCRSLANWIGQNQNYVVLVVLYTIVMMLIFIERAYYYSVEREHGGLRRIAGYGVTVTRGAASAMMFTYSTLLITMCRNIMLFLRSSFLHRCIPFDNMVDMHRYIGAWALFWSICHVVGHAVNFYHISTQTPPDLLCLFRDYFRGTHILPKFQYWCWQTITGVTGILLTLQIAVIYSFAYLGRRYFFKIFWITHNTYPLLYLLMALHGSGILVQKPIFLTYLLAPCVLFILDKLVSISRNTVKIDVIRADHLPSGVTKLTISKPLNFNHESGQWVKIASLDISKLEYHPFTLSSAPHEENLTLHIRAVGPWTKKIIKTYPDYKDIENQEGFKYSQIFMDGPFGEGHQTWQEYEVAVLVGSGIGVTPFTSILKDLIYKLKQPNQKLKTKKVYFLWVTRSQSQYEWVIDILRQVEEADENRIIRNHIFITQFKSKYDFRTIMLYLAERHFQKISGNSLFTGLRGLTHFSRPDFHAVLTSIRDRYRHIPVIGVFTCGGAGVSNNVELGCQALNKEDGPIFKHYYENF